MDSKLKGLMTAMLLSVIIHGCKQNEEQYKVTVDLDGAGGKWIKLTTRIDRNYVVIDSVLAGPEGPAVMTGQVDSIRTVYLSVEGEQSTSRLLLENAEYTISGSMENPQIETGSEAQQDLNEYNEMTAALDESLSSIVEEYYSAMEQENQAAADSILSRYERVSQQKGELDSVYLSENPSSYASVLLLRGSFYSLDPEEFESALGALDPSLHQMQEYQYMAALLERQKEVAVGNPYKDFELKTPEGEVLSVSDVHNDNVLLIDFWASWCGPCRRANPELVEIYNDYNDQGFEILGVSLDRDRKSWLDAIEEDNLTWHHISDLEYWNSKGAKLYGVPAIPHTVLIDREGIIVAKKLHGPELREAIENLF